MKIIITGGGTGGHFYPLIAVVDALNSIFEQEKIVEAKIIFMSDSPYNENILFERGITFKKISAGKMRRYFSLLNVVDFFKTFFGTIKTIWSIYLDFPDIIFSKGGYVSLPVIIAAKVLRIPLIIHESDAIFGHANKIALPFAKRVAVSFSKTMENLPEKIRNKIALTGNPIRKQFFISDKEKTKDDGKIFFKLQDNIPVIFIIGGSQGAKKINDIVLETLKELVEKYYIIHQCGEKNIDDVKSVADIVLEKSSYKYRYIPYSSLNELEIKMAYGVVDLVISRAGAGSIFEISASGTPSILIPLENSAQNHQRENTYEYAKHGATDIIEEINLSPHVFLSEIDRTINDKEKLLKMSKEALKFSKPNAAEEIAREIIKIVLKHN